ncbi:hypothetical protein MAPG_00745 [Magnaporthiopsis poae ATCC 64411]|uniref:Uncharacterized protein n=1 Tax=Magnaporthiopsis poae (strain ATCC 64411 / 73-15) TaxID=644358 RepID=A0A0C4DLU9_MAGP6|nr:hypothetical protein MAPG_00745 [Magnaporthiopsis poae ATCC 64411]
MGAPAFLSTDRCIKIPYEITWLSNGKEGAAPVLVLLRLPAARCHVPANRSRADGLLKRALPILPRLHVADATNGRLKGDHRAAELFENRTETAAATVASLSAGRQPLQGLRGPDSDERLGKAVDATEAGQRDVHDGALGTRRLQRLGQVLVQRPAVRHREQVLG